MQGKYLPVIRRGILLNDGLLSEGNDYFQGLWKTVKDRKGQSKTMKDKDLSSEYKESISVQKVETFYTKIERLINRR